MSDTPTYERRAKRQARLMRIANVLMRRVLALPFDTPISRRLMLLRFTGRKSGRMYRQPVSYVADGDVLLTPGGGKWKLNLVDGQPISVRLRGRDVLATPELVGDPVEVERLLGRMMSLNPRLASFVPFIEKDREIDKGRLHAAIEHGFRIVRWTISSPAKTRGSVPKGGPRHVASEAEATPGGPPAGGR